MSTELLNKLQKHFEETNIEQIKLNWEEIQRMNFSSPHAHEFINHLCYTYTFECPNYNWPPEEMELPEYLTPNFSESFFFHKLAL